MHPNVKLLVGPLLALSTFVACRLTGAPDAATWTASITALCAAWWVTEALPIPITSLIPFVFFPLFGVATPKQLASAYGHPLILLLLAGFMLSKAMEQSLAHRRLSLMMLRAVGGDAGRQLVLGFMLTSGLMSMWISNSATTLMLLPVATAVLEQQADDASRQRLAKPLMLGIAYAASIGGLGTPIGTPPNVVFMAVYAETFDKSVSFLEWMTFGVPAVVLLLPIAFFWLTRQLRYRSRLELPPLGPWRKNQKRVLMVFGVTALLWITRSAPFGGWQSFLPNAEVDDGTVALLAVLCMFILPDGEGERLVSWSSASTIPWGLLLLFAGGLAIATAFESSGLSTLLASGLSAATTWPTVLMIGATCLAVTFLTEVTSNMATAALLLPVLAAAATAASVDPMQLMIPATLSASCAFMLPVATVPNAIVFGTGSFSTKEMASEGFVVNLLCAAALTLLCWWMF